MNGNFILKIDSVSMIPVLDIGDTLTIQFSLYAKLKVETQRRFFKFFVEHIIIRAVTV